MRRPLNWIVVSVSLLVLTANWVLVTRLRDVTAWEHPVQTASLEPGMDSPFAYIREDGSLIPVPATGAAPPSSRRERERLLFQ